MLLEPALAPHPAAQRLSVAADSSRPDHAHRYHSLERLWIDSYTVSIATGNDRFWFQNSG